MTLNTEQLLISTTDAALRRVAAGIAVNLGDVIAPDRTNFISADEIYISGEVRTHGHLLTLLARRVIFNEGARVVTDGEVGLPNIPAGQPSEGPRTPGAAGPDGEDGGAGCSAGEVVIMADEVLGILQISAVGGTGGRPRDGGDGFTGADGAPGVPARGSFGGSAPPQCNGQPGLQGGAVGLPGRRGPGGAGGKVRVSTRVALGADRCQVNVSAGAASEPGVAGKPGGGGAGGAGAIWTVRDCFVSGPMRVMRVENIPGLADFEENKTKALKSMLLVPEADYFSKDDPHAFSTESTVSPGLLLHSAAATLMAPTREICTTVTAGSGTRGDPGLPGDFLKSAVAERLAEPSPAPADGAFELSQIDAESFATKFDSSALDLIVMAAEDQYRQAGRAPDASLRALIEFLLAVCKDDPAPDSAKFEMLGRVYAMARRITLGLDFYGYALEDAPLVSFETYRNIIDVGVLRHAEVIERTYHAYRDAFDAKEVSIGLVRESRSQAATQRQNLADELDRIINVAKSARTQLGALDDKVVACLVLLMQREKDLTASINRRSNGCNLLGTLQACATIAVGVATGGAGFIAAAGAGAKLFQDLEANSHSVAELWDTRNLIGDDLKELGKQAKTVDEAINAIQEGVKKLSPEFPRVPSYTMERSKFDQVASEFQSLPEAASYREAGYAYLSAVETRNTAIVSYNGQLTQCIQLDVTLRSADRTVEAMDAVISGKRNPADAGVICMITRLYRDMLALFAMMVHTERKALAYHFVTPMDAPLSAFDVATITAAHSRASTRDWAEAKERYAVKRDLEPGLLELDLATIAGPIAWTEFKRTGAIAFSIRHDHPKYIGLLGNLFGLRLTGLELVLDGAKAGAYQDQLSWDMTHGGREMILRRQQPPARFTHRSIIFSGTTSLSGKKPIVNPDFSERNLYAGVSPYASWLLVFTFIKEQGIDLRNLSKASLKLHGYLME